MTMARLTPVDVDTPFRVRLTAFCRAHGIQVHTPSQVETLSPRDRVVRLMWGTVFERMEVLNLRLPENQRVEDALGRVLEYCSVRLLVSGASGITLSPATGPFKRIGTIQSMRRSTIAGGADEIVVAAGRFGSAGSSVR